MPAYPDEQLVTEALGDSRLAFEQLVEQYQYRVLRTIASIVSDEQAAQDVAQETFLSAWSNLVKLKEKHKFGRWLNQTAINLSKRWLRDQRRYQEHTASLKDMITLAQERRYHSDKLRHEVWEAIDELTQDYRDVVILHYISGYSYKEISEMLSVPFSTIVGRLQEARNQLRKEFLDMVTKLQLEIDSTVHSFLKEHAKRDGLSIEGLIIRLIERYKRDMDSPEIAVRKVWDTVPWFYGVSPSPDGRYVSHINWETGGNLAIHDFETGENRDVTDEGDPGRCESTESIWSPDSKQIAYRWFSAEKGSSLRIVSIDGSKPRVLCSIPAGSGFLMPQTWSRDGKHILASHHKKTDGTHDFVLVSVADGSIRVLKSLDGYGPWHNMSLSPDGRYVVYDSPESEDSPNCDIFLFSTDGSHEMTLVEHPAHDFAPFWAPDGNRIMFISDRSGSMGIWVLEVIDGKPKGSPRLIKHNLNGVFPLGLTQGGSYYYGFGASDSDIYVATLDPETGQVVIPPAKAVHSFEGFNSWPVFSPDGKYLAYVSRRPRIRDRNFSVLVIRSLETGEERELSPEDIVVGHNPCWSPDGRSILVYNIWHIATEAGIYRIDTETGAATRVVLWHDEQGDIVLGPFVQSPDGNRIFFMRKSGGIIGIRVYDCETKRERKLEFQLACGEYFRGHRSGFTLSPDGQQLALMLRCDDEWSLQIAPSSGGDTREVLRLKKYRGLVWTPDGRHLLLFGNFKDESTGLCELWRMPVEGGVTQNLDIAVKRPKDLSIHPDGRRIAFTGPGPAGGEMWAMENFLPGFTADR